MKEREKLANDLWLLQLCSALLSWLFSRSVIKQLEFMARLLSYPSFECNAHLLQSTEPLEGLNSLNESNSNLKAED